MGSQCSEREFDCQPNDRIHVGSNTTIKVLVVDDESIELEISQGGKNSIFELRIPADSDVNPDDNPDSAKSFESEPDERESNESGERWTLEFLLLGDLIELLEEGYDEENRRWMLVVLDGLLDAIPAQRRHDRLETLRARFPNAVHLPNVLTRLELEHDELVYQLRKLRNRVAWRFSLLDVVGAEVCDELKSWVVTFTSFTKREARLRRHTERASCR